MDSLAQLEIYSGQLAKAVQSLVDHHRSTTSADHVPEEPEIDDLIPDADLERAKANISASVAGIKTLILGPANFLQHLTSQVEILACLQWLAEFQILLCIPLEGCVPIKDIADLTGVPYAQLGRVIRLTTTSGFLSEPRSGFVSHTALSAHLISNQSFLDAVIFLAETTTPAALEMTAGTQRFGARQGSGLEGSAAGEGVYNLSFKAPTLLHMLCQERPELSRRQSAFLRHAAGLPTATEVADMLSQLNWSNLNNPCVVEVNAQSTSMARRLADLHPNLRLVVQIIHASHSDMPITERPTLSAPPHGWNEDSGASEATSSISISSTNSSSSSSSSSGRITVMERHPGTPQPVTNAAVYILHLPVASTRAPAMALLHEHLGVLRASGGVMLILTARLLPEPGSLSDPEVEAVARARDLSMLQLSNEGEMEMTELLDIIKTVKDSVGSLVIADRLRAPTGLVVALAVKHQAHAEAQVS